MRQNEVVQGENTSPQRIKKNWIQAGVLALASILLLFVAFSLPPWDMGSVKQDVAVVLMALVLLLGWAGLGFVLGMASKSVPVSPTRLLPKAIRAAGLAASLLAFGWLLGFWVFDFDSELKVGVSLFFILAGICLSVAALAGSWSQKLGVPMWLGIIGAGMGSITVLAGAITIASMYLGDSVIQVNTMMLY